MARGRSQDDEIEPQIERLYALPPAAFTAARNELAARLRREGRRDAAGRVKALPRPTPSSWAVSRLMRLEPARFQALLAAGRQAREAQRRVLRGGAAAAAAPAAQLREALAAARQAIEELRRRGGELLVAGGKPPTAMTIDRLAADLQALAFTAGAESEVARGWLDHDLEAPGFEVLAGLQAAAGRGAAPEAAAPHRPASRPSRRQAPEVPGPASRPARQIAGSPRPAPTWRREIPEPRRPRDEQARREQARQEQARREQARQEQAQREQARLEQVRERARARLAAAEADVERVARESARLTAAAATAERAAADARRRAEGAEREAERARRGARQAAERLEQARTRLAAARAAAGRVTASGASGGGRRPGDETR